MVIRRAPILLILLALAGCGSGGDPGRRAASGPPLVIPRPSHSSTVRPRPVRAGTVCGQVTTVSGFTARVIVARGRATCEEALRVMREYNDPATPAEGTAGLAVIDHWTCGTLRRVTTCTLRAAAIQARP